MAVYVEGRSISPPPSYEQVLRETAAATGQRFADLPPSSRTVDLPTEIISYIMQYLSVSDRKDAALVCKRWYEASLHPMVQKSVLVAVKSSVTNPRPFTALRNRSEFHLALSDIDGSPNSGKLLEVCQANLGPKLLTLSLKGSNISPNVLSTILNKCSNLMSLDISCCNNLLLAGSCLGSHLAGVKLPSLQHLDLSSLRQLSDASLNAFLQAAPNLQSLELSSAPLLFGSSLASGADSRPSSAALTFHRLLHLLEELASFSSINLSRTSVSNRALQLLGQVPRLTLHKVKLVSCKEVSDGGVVVLTQLQPSIRHLDLAANGQLTSTCVKHISSNLTNLEYLNLTKIHLHPKDIKHLYALSACTQLVLSSSLLQPLPLQDSLMTFQVWAPRLTSLDLSFCAGLSNTVLVSMCQYLTELTELNISSCFQLDDTSVRQISRCLLKLRCLSAGWLKHITDLGLLGSYHSDFTHDCENLCRCGRERNMSYFEYTPPVKDIAPKELVPTAEHIKSAIAQQGHEGQFPLSTLVHLKSLDLSMCSKITDKGVSEAIAFPSLSSLNLSLCVRLTDVALIALASNNPLLERLNVAQCAAITDKGVYAVLISCRRLAHLNLSGCPQITDQTLLILMKMRVKLKTLDVSMCNMSMETIDTLERLMPTLCTIHKRYTSDSSPRGQ